MAEEENCIEEFKKYMKAYLDIETTFSEQEHPLRANEAQEKMLEIGREFYRELNPTAENSVVNELRPDTLMSYAQIAQKSRKLEADNSFKKGLERLVAGIADEKLEKVFGSEEIVRTAGQDYGIRLKQREELEQHYRGAEALAEIVNTMKEANKNVREIIPALPEELRAEIVRNVARVYSNKIDDDEKYKPYPVLHREMLKKLRYDAVVSQFVGISAEDLSKGVEELKNNAEKQLKGFDEKNKPELLKATRKALKKLAGGNTQSSEYARNVTYSLL